jgi:hypothetical protein
MLPITPNAVTTAIMHALIPGKATRSAQVRTDERDMRAPLLLFIKVIEREALRDGTAYSKQLFGRLPGCLGFLFL